MISKVVEGVINNQINAEEYSARMYTSMASWCETKGMPGFAKFLYQHSEEEDFHSMKFMKYLNGKGGHALVGSVEAPPQQFKDIKDVFEQIYAHECKVSGMINDMYVVASNEKDFATCNFLQWYITEQIEEEETFSGILDKIKLAGESNLYTLDAEMVTMTATAAAAFAIEKQTL